MKLVSGDPNPINVKPLISTNAYSIVAEVNEKNLIIGFKVKLYKSDKEVYVPVATRSAAGYMKAWTQVYNIVKPTL